MRPSRKPLLRSKFPKNRTVAFTCVIADKESHGFMPCEDQLAILYAMAEQDKDLVLSHGGIALPFHVRMTGLTVTAEQRNDSGLITQAKIQINLKESVTINQEIVFMTAVPHEPKVVTAGVNPGVDPEGRSWTDSSEGGRGTNSALHASPIMGQDDGQIGLFNQPPVLIDFSSWSGGPLVSEGYHG
jgi:hypothetical protein